MPIKSILARFGLRVTRRLNRFDAMPDVLTALRSGGFSPPVIIDGGANVGQWARKARAVFPRAEFHLIEPQAACAPRLKGLGTLHAVALTEGGAGSVRFIVDAPQTSGAWVAEAGEREGEGLDCPATTLDALFSGLSEADILLKLDLEGHDLAALRGGEALLQRVEVVIVEVSFHRPDRPTFADILAHLGARSFVLFDFAALGGGAGLKTGDAVFVRADSPLAGMR